MLLEATPLPTCTCVVPTQRPIGRSAGHREVSAGALATGITVISGSAHCAIAVWVLVAPPTSTTGYRRYVIDDASALATGAPVSALEHVTHVHTPSLLYAGTVAGTIHVWDSATWQPQQRIEAHTHSNSRSQEVGAG